MTRAFEYGSPEWRRWKHDHHWAAGSGAPADPLGAGNTQLLSDLGVTPFLFYDGRKGVTLATGVSSLADVSGVGTYGPALVQATQANQPAYSGGTLTFDGANDFLVSASNIGALDLSSNKTITVVAVLDVPNVLFHPAVYIGAAAGASPNWNAVFVRTGPVVQPSTDKLALGGSNPLPTPGTQHLIVTTVVISGTNVTLTCEIPNNAKASNGGAVGPEASAAMFLALGANTAGVNPVAIKFRALLAWLGNYTTAQRDTLKTWSQTYHAATLA